MSVLLLTPQALSENNSIAVSDNVFRNLSILDVLSSERDEGVVCESDPEYLSASTNTNVFSFTHDLGVVMVVEVGSLKWVLVLTRH